MTETKTLVPTKLAMVAGFLSPVLLALAPILPAVAGVALGPIATILAFILAALAGLALPQVKFAAHKPLIPITMVPMVAACVPMLMQVAMALHGVASAAVQAVALVLAFAAGLASPAPVVASLPATTKAAVVAELGK